MRAFAILLALFCALAPAQDSTTTAKTNAEQPKPAGPKADDESPELKAWRAAVKIEDPKQRIEALTQFLQRHSKTPFASGARWEIFRATVEVSPEDKKRVLGAAKDYIRRTSKNNRRYSLESAASTLGKAGIFLDQAERYARKSLGRFKQKPFFEEQRKQAARAKRPAPTEEEMLQRFRDMQSRPLETLGLILLKKGNKEEAKSLLEQAYSYNASRADAATALAQSAEESGDEDTALEYLMMARLSGRISREGRERLEQLYSRRNGGSVDGMEEALDEMYRKKFPPPLHGERYEPPPSRTERVVLAEIFTGAGCPPCVAADLAFDVVLERYGRQDVAVVMYHQHIPQPDPMTHPPGENRFQSYERGGVPTYVIDGKKDGGGGPRDAAKRIYEKIHPRIEEQLAVPPQSSILLDAAMEADKVNVTATVENVSAEARDVRLHILLVEEMLRYSGENGIRFHPMVVRSIAGPDAAGFPFDPSERFEVEHVFDIPKIVRELKAHLDDYEVNGRHGKITFIEKKHEIDPTRLAVVAFVQDAESKEVLQSAFREVGRLPGPLSRSTSEME